jgi:hypothetical protein
MDISKQVNELRMRIAEEKRKWGFDEEIPSIQQEPSKKVVKNTPNESDDLKAKLLGLKKR